jgi:hypothetical protein
VAGTASTSSWAITVDWALGPIYYAVIPHPVGNSDNWGFNSFQQQTDVSSHELAEAATDPDCQTGWQDPTTGIEGEIGDLAMGYHARLDGYVVQAEYLNSYGGPVIPYGSTPFIPGGFAAVRGAGRGQPGMDGNSSSSLSNPIPASGSSVLSSATDLSQNLGAGIHRAGADSHTDDFFAALAERENGATNPLKRGISESQRTKAGTGWESTTFASPRGKDAVNLAGPLMSDLAGLEALSL